MNQPRVDLAVPIQATDHALGPDHARVIVVEYGDFECPRCKAAAPAVKMLLDDYASDVRFVFRHFPLEEAHPHALAAAEAAECAGEQGKFWEMSELLFANQTHLQSKHLRDYADHAELHLATSRVHRLVNCEPRLQSRRTAPVTRMTRPGSCRSRRSPA